jgi:hypothetical protein
VPDFDKPINEDVVEYQDVDAIEVQMDPDTKKAVLKKVIHKVPITVRYSRKDDPVKMSCKEGSHFWEVIDRNKHIIACKNCPKRRFVRRAFEKVDKDGHFIDIATGTIID